MRYNKDMVNDAKRGEATVDGSYASKKLPPIYKEETVTVTVAYCPVCSKRLNLERNIDALTIRSHYCTYCGYQY